MPWENNQSRRRTTLNQNQKPVSLTPPTWFVSKEKQNVMGDNPIQMMVHLGKGRLQLVTGVWQVAVAYAATDHLRLAGPWEFKSESQKRIDCGLNKFSSTWISFMHVSQFPHRKWEQSLLISMYCLDLIYICTSSLVCF